MEQKIITTYDKQTLTDFKRFTLTKKSHFKPAILYLLCLVVIVLAFVYNKKFELNFTTIIYPSIAIFCMLVITLLYYIKPHSENDALLDKQVEYIFLDDEIVAGNTSFLFSDFNRVYEDKYYYYFYITENEGFIIDKDNVGFDMSAYLTEKIQDKKVLRLMKSK